MGSAVPFGIYLNRRDGTLLRITSPYWVPEGPDWVRVTEDPNATLTQVRALVRERGLYPDPEAVRWGTLPLRD